MPSQAAGQCLDLVGPELREGLRGGRSELVMSLEAIDIGGFAQARKVGRGGEVPLADSLAPAWSVAEV
jgi:hypothetical protein